MKLQSCPRESSAMTQLTRSVAGSDSHLVQILDRYLAALQSGNLVDKAALLAQYPELADDLEACLGSLDFIREAAVSAARAEAGSAAAGAPLPAGTLGDFNIHREIGRGGMGIVYEAEQISLRRRVALKVLPFAAALDAKQLQRFKNEAQAAAHLHHTNIVPVYAVGCERGVHFYAMQFIEGQTVAGLIRELRQLAGLEAADPAPVAPASALVSDLLSGRWVSVSGGERATDPYHSASPPPHLTTSQALAVTPAI